MRIQASQEGRAGRSAYRIAAIRAIEAHSGGGQTVEMRSPGDAIPRRAHSVAPVLVGHEQQDIRRTLGLRAQVL